MAAAILDRRNGAGKRASRLGAVSLMALGLSACVSMQQQRLAPGEQPVLVGPAVRDNRTPMDAALACFADHLSVGHPQPLVIGVGDVRDYTGKYSVNEGNAITQGGALMVYSALGKLRGTVSLAERFDPTIAERELGYTDRRQLGDGGTHQVAGPAGKQAVPWLPYYGGSIAASDYYIVGGITELNYDIRSGGLEAGFNAVGPKARTYTQSVAIDLRIVDTRSLLVVKTVSLTKQFTGYEIGFGIFRFFGSDLFDINIGAKGQEPLQLGIRTALEDATMRLVGAVAQVDPEPCMSQRSWLIAAPPAGLATPGAVDRQSAPPPSVRSAFRSNAQAINSLSTTGGSSPGGQIQIPFEFGAAGLSGAAQARLDRIATAAAKGAIEVMIVARDTENLDPGKRDALTNQRIAAITAALAARGVAAGAVAIIWRADPSDTAIHRDGPGLQNVARLRVGG